MKTIQAHETEAVVRADGSVWVAAVPFEPGQTVEVIVLERDQPIPTTGTDRYPLRGRKPYRFDDPFSPVGVEDWELLK